MKRRSKENLKTTTVLSETTNSHNLAIHPENQPETKNSINPQDLCKIIEACSQAGIKELRMGDLYLSFTPAVSTSLPEERQPERLHTEQINFTPPEPQDEATDLGNLLISDPLAYEEALMRESNG